MCICICICICRCTCTCICICICISICTYICICMCICICVYVDVDAYVSFFDKDLRHPLVFSRQPEWNTGRWRCPSSARKQRVTLYKVQAEREELHTRMDMDTAPTLRSRVGYNRRRTPRSTTNGVQREYRPSTAYEKQILSSKTRLPMLDITCTHQQTDNNQVSRTIHAGDKSSKQNQKESTHIKTMNAACTRKSGLQTQKANTSAREQNVKMQAQKATRSRINICWRSVKTVKWKRAWNKWESGQHLAYKTSWIAKDRHHTITPAGSWQHMQANDTLTQWWGVGRLWWGVGPFVLPISLSPFLFLPLSLSFSLSSSRSCLLPLLPFHPSFPLLPPLSWTEFRQQDPKQHCHWTLTSANSTSTFLWTRSCACVFLQGTLFLFLVCAVHCFANALQLPCFTFATLSCQLLFPLPHSSFV